MNKVQVKLYDLRTCQCMSQFTHSSHHSLVTSNSLSITYEKWNRPYSMNIRRSKLLCWAATIKFPWLHRFPNLSLISGLFPDFSPTIAEFPDISRFFRKAVTLDSACACSATFHPAIARNHELWSYRAEPEATTHYPAPFRTPQPQPRRTVDRISWPVGEETRPWLRSRRGSAERPAEARCRSQRATEHVSAKVSLPARQPSMPMSYPHERSVRTTTLCSLQCSAGFLRSIYAPQRTQTHFIQTPVLCIILKQQLNRSYLEKCFMFSDSVLLQL